MRKITILFTLAITALSLNCGGGTATNNTANKPANTSAAANKPATTPATTPAATNTEADKKETGSNADLDFTLVNKTGYAIKEVLVGPTATKEWTPDMEILKGKSLADGGTIDVKFHPKATASNWDIKVEWADGSGSEEWIKLDLTTIEKVTLKYDKATDKTTAEIE